MEQLVALFGVIVQNLWKALKMATEGVSTERIQSWIGAPLELQEAVARALKDILSRIPLKVWKTIKLVVYQNADQCLKALEAAGCKVDDWAKDLIRNKVDFTKFIEEDVDLVKLSVAQLGFVEGATLRQILERALQMGLLKCQSIDGPNLRSQYLDQLLGETVWLGMDPIAGSHGRLLIFSLRRDGDGLWLNALYDDLDRFFHAGRVFIFRLRPSTRA